jgi:hypothetical protein
LKAIATGGQETDGSAQRIYPEIPTDVSFQGFQIFFILSQAFQMLPNHHHQQQLYAGVRFQVLTAASMMFRVVFWDILPCKMIVERRFRGFIPDDGGCTHL